MDILIKSCIMKKINQYSKKWRNCNFKSKLFFFFFLCSILVLAISLFFAQCRNKQLYDSVNIDVISQAISCKEYRFFARCRIKLRNIYRNLCTASTIIQRIRTTFCTITALFCSNSSTISVIYRPQKPEAVSGLGKFEIKGIGLSPQPFSSLELPHVQTMDLVGPKVSPCGPFKFIIFL